MEFNEKLQYLRKRRGITQDELAQCLYVSRAAVSKWESGRGYPNIDSLKAIAQFYGVTVDELLSGEVLLAFAQEDAHRKENHIRNLVFGLLDCSSTLLLFLPFFGNKADGGVAAVCLLSLTAVEPWLLEAYYLAVIGMTAAGILMLAMRHRTNAPGAGKRHLISCILNAACVLLLIASLQPYAAAFLFLFLILKTLMLVKWQ